MNNHDGKDPSPNGPNQPPSGPPSLPCSRAPTISRKPRRRAISVVSMDQGIVKLAYTESKTSLEDTLDEKSAQARDMNGGILTLDPDDPQASGQYRINL